MKKINAVLVTSMMIAFTILSGCGAPKDDKSDVKFFEEVTSANILDKLVEKNEMVSYEIVETYGDGEVFEYAIYQDKEKFISYSDVDVQVYEDNEIYGYIINDEGDKVIYRMAFPNTSYDEYASYYKWKAICEVNPNEKIVEKEAKDGIITVKSNHICDETSVDLVSSFLFDVEEVEAVSLEYKIDETTLEILEMYTYFVIGDEKVMVSSLVRKDKPEKYAVDEDVVTALANPEKRTVTLIEAAGTENEKTYVETVEKGVAVRFFCGIDFDGVLYEDPECTKTITANYNEDQTVYMK